MKTITVKGDYTVPQAQERLGLPSKSTFWRSIWRGVAAGVVKVIKHGPSCFTIDAESLEAWRENLAISSVKDFSLKMDGRRSS